MFALSYGLAQSECALINADRNHPNVIVTPSQAEEIATSASFSAWSTRDHGIAYPDDRVSPYARRSLLTNARAVPVRGYKNPRPPLRRQYSWNS